MMKLPTKATKILDKLTEGLTKVGDSRKIDNSNGAFMAACIDIIDRTHQGWLIVSVAHYFEQNGDLCCDPDVTILRAKDGDYAMTFQQAIPPVYQQPLRIEGGTIRVNEKAQRDLTLFVQELLTNINEQQDLGV
jgi:hypothetical protein